MRSTWAKVGRWRRTANAPRPKLWQLESSAQSSATGNLKPLGVEDRQRMGFGGRRGRNGRGAATGDGRQIRGSTRRMVGDSGRWTGFGEGEFGRVRDIVGEQGRLGPVRGEVGRFHGDDDLAMGCAKEGERGRKEALVRRVTVSRVGDGSTCRGVSFGLETGGLGVDAATACSGSVHWTWRTFARRRCVRGRLPGSSAQHCCMSTQSSSGSQ